MEKLKKIKENVERLQVGKIRECSPTPWDSAAEVVATQITVGTNKKLLKYESERLVDECFV